MTLIVVATITPLPEHRDEVIAAFEEAIPQVHEEAGCELYALTEKDDRLVMIEKYASADAFEIHGRSPVLAALGAKLAGKLVEAFDVQVLTPHPVGDGAKGAL